MFADLGEVHANSENMTLEELKETICKIYPGKENCLSSHMLLPVLPRVIRSIKTYVRFLGESVHLHT